MIWLLYIYIYLSSEFLINLSLFINIIYQFNFMINLLYIVYRSDFQDVLIKNINFFLFYCYHYLLDGFHYIRSL